MNMANVYTARVNQQIFIEVTKADRTLADVEIHVGMTLQEVIDQCIQRWDLNLFNPDDDEASIWDMNRNCLWLLSDYVESLDEQASEINEVLQRGYF